MKDQIFEKMGKDGDHFDTVKVYIKDGKYAKIANKKNTSTLIYLPEENKIYNLEDNFEYALIMDASKFNSLNLKFKEPEVFEIDTTKTIYGIDRKLLKLSWPNMGEEFYFYNEQTASIDPALFEKHNYEYLNLVLNRTNAYPMEIIKSVNQVMTVRLTLVSLEQRSVDDTYFQIPDLKKANKDYADMIRMTTGNEVMKIKE